MSDEMREALLPCPFCGGEAYTSYSDRGELWSVRCNHWKEYGGSEVCMGSGAYRDTEKEAIAYWNTRAALASNQQVTQGELAEAIDGVPWVKVTKQGMDFEGPPSAKIIARALLQRIDMRWK